MSTAGEILVPFPATIPRVRHLKSTVIAGSVDVIRATRHWDAYRRALDPRHQDAILGAVAASWVPLEAAQAHYAACDTLPFTADEHVANGRKSFDKAGASIFGTVLKMAREVGVTPWTLLVQFQRFWSRACDGGAVEVVKIGPKDANVNMIQVPFYDSRYFRNVVRGLVGAGVGLFCTKAYMTERPGTRMPGSVNYRVQWA